MKTCKVCSCPIRSNSVRGFCRKTTKCRTARKNDWVARNRQRSREWHNEYERNHRLEAVLRSMQNRASKQGIEYSLSKEDVAPEPARCPCCDTAMERGGNRNVTPSLDRVIPDKGYVPGNIQWLCGRCNRIKQDATAEELMKLATFMARIVRGIERKEDTA